MTHLYVHLPIRPSDELVRGVVARTLGVAPQDVSFTDANAGRVGVLVVESGAPFGVQIIVGADVGDGSLTDADLGAALAQELRVDVLCETHRFDDPSQHDGVIVHPDGKATFFWDDDETNFRLDSPAVASTAAE